MRLEDATFVVVDTETTGTQPDGRDRLTELAAVKMVGGEVVDTFSELINPGRHIPARITQITGISTAMVYDAPPAAEVLARFLEFLGPDGVFVAHNLPFDWRFVQAELARAGLPPLEHRGLCTCRLARRLVPQLKSKGLSALVAHYGIGMSGRHRALPDAEATAEVLRRFIERARTSQGIETVDELLAFQHKRYRDALGEPAPIRRIRADVLPRLPDAPGVYYMKGRGGEVIYVGKARSLRNRVRSYFSGIDAHPEWTRKLVMGIRDVTWTETGSDLAALLLESREIKERLPRFNRAQRRYRTYPFLRLDTTRAFPTLAWSPLIRADGAEYYGPVGRRGAAEALLELVHRVFPLRECDDGTFQRAAAAQQPCLYHHIGRCSGPCALPDAAAEYPAVVDRVRAFLTGMDDDALDAVDAAMRDAARRLDFEGAATLRDGLARLRRLLDRQREVASAVHDHDAVLVEPGLRPGDVQLFFIRFGRLVHTHDLPTPPSPADAAALEAALAAHYRPGEAPPEMLEKADVDAMRIIAHWVRLHPDVVRRVRWAPDRPPAAFAAEVLAAVAALPGPAAPAPAV